MFEKSEVNVSLAEVLKEVVFPWIIVSMVFILALKSVSNFDGLSFLHSVNVYSSGVISNEHKEAQRSSIINLRYISDI